LVEAGQLRPQVEAVPALEQVRAAAALLLVSHESSYLGGVNLVVQAEPRCSFDPAVQPRWGQNLGNKWWSLGGHGSG
jgi:hypothetical protein